MTTYEKNITYNAQGETISQNTTPSYMTTTYTAPLQNVQSAGLVSDNPSLNDPGYKGKMLRFYNKIETSMRKKWDASSGPSSRTDPLGGYTVKGPGYYEKKHKITRRITSRGNPPPMQLSNGCQTVSAKNTWGSSQDSYTIQENALSQNYSTTPISSQNYTPPPLPQQNTSTLTPTTPVYSTTPMNTQTTSSAIGSINSSTPLSSQNYPSSTPLSSQNYSTSTTQNITPLPSQNYSSSTPLTSPSNTQSTTPLSSQTIPQQNINNIGSQNTYPSSTTPFTSSAPFHYSSPSAPNTLPVGFPTSYATPSVPTC